MVYWWRARGDQSSTTDSAHSHHSLPSETTADEVRPAVLHLDRAQQRRDYTTALIQSEVRTAVVVIILLSLRAATQERYYPLSGV